ncbi:MAG: GDP-mannose 4,6-dehydratase, partial [Ignavibacteriales bacterium]|nr:GDP-mannose 4,6-dehydratase [Ignavibacteriales bacterium]
MPTALVTGGTGFVGSHTIELLLQRGFQVRCLVRRSRANLGWAQ